MKLLALLTTVAGLVVASDAVSVWSKTSDYIDFAVFKSCFGENATLILEVRGLEVGRRCFKEYTTPPLATTERTSPIITTPRAERTPPTATPVADDGKRRSEDPLARNKRNILKYPEGAPPAVQFCSLRGLNLTTSDNKVNTEAIEKWIQDVVVDPTLKSELLGLSSSCLDTPVREISGPDLPPGSVDARLFSKLVYYLSCLNKGGLKACMDYELRRYSDFFV